MNILTNLPSCFLQLPSFIILFSILAFIIIVIFIIIIDESRKLGELKQLTALAYHTDENPDILKKIQDQDFFLSINLRINDEKNKNTVNK